MNSRPVLSINFNGESQALANLGDIVTTTVRPIDESLMPYNQKSAADHDFREAHELQVRLNCFRLACNANVVVDFLPTTVDSPKTSVKRLDDFEPVFNYNVKLPMTFDEISAESEPEQAKPSGDLGAPAVHVCEIDNYPYVTRRVGRTYVEVPLGFNEDQLQNFLTTQPAPYVKPRNLRAYVARKLSS